MSIWAASVTKSAQYQGVFERWSNVYHYSFPALDGPGAMSVAQAQDFANELVATERLYHSSSAIFQEVRVWGPVEQGPSISDTVGIFSFSGGGSRPARTPGMSLEDCFVVSMRTNRQTARSRPIYLRKFLRTLTGPDGLSVSVAQLAHLEQITPDQRSSMIAYADDIAGVSIVTGGPIVGILCAPSGAQVPAEPPRPVRVEDYIRSHELRY